MFDLQKWILSHSRMIQSPIENDCIKVKFHYGNGGVKTELHLKVLIQVSVRGIYI